MSTPLCLPADVFFFFLQEEGVNFLLVFEAELAKNRAMTGHLWSRELNFGVPLAQ